MADFMARGMTWLNGKLRDRVSEEIIYTRGADSVSIQATLGSSHADMTDGTGAVRRERVNQAFMFSAADLILNGVATLPLDGDKITSQGVIYDVMPAHEPAQQFSDSQGNRLRVHSKFRSNV